MRVLFGPNGRCATRHDRRLAASALAVRLLAGAVALLGSQAATAQVCTESTVEEGLQYLRRLSLDLRGRFPDVAEMESVVTNAGVIDPSIIRGIVRSEDAVEALRQHHRNLLWTNVTDLRLSNQEWQLGLDRRTGAGDIYSMNGGRARRYRGGDQYGACLDEPARFGAAGEILTTPDANDPTQQREGWVLVRPYWNPSTEIKVCAFDAQTNLTGMSARRTVDCRIDSSATQCGCGPNLSWCQSQPDRTAAKITAAMGEQLLRFMDKVVREGRPYTEVLTARDIEVNGPLSHYLRFQTQDALNFLFATPDHDFAVPELAFTEDQTWVSAMREATHAGVLTMPGYLLKFQSNRGRANRFYNAFLCQSFKAPEGGLAAADDECHSEPDLTKRCGCKYCHVTVEPAAAYWGRWSEAGFAPMDEATYPKVRTDCADPQNARNPLCRRFYLTSPGHPDEEAYKGYLMPYVFATPQREANIAQGPRGIADAAIANGSFASCATRQLYERLVAREAVETDQAALDALSASFVASSYDVRALIESIVTRPEYVEAGRFTGGAQ